MKKFFYNWLRRGLKKAIKKTNTVIVVAQEKLKYLNDELAELKTKIDKLDAK